MKQRHPMLTDEVKNLVVQELAARWDEVPAGILSTIDLHKAELLPRLRELAMDAIKLVEHGSEADARFFARLSILFGAFEYAPAHTVLERVLRLEDPAAWLGDFLQVIPLLLARTCNGHYTILRTIALNKALPAQARTDAVEAMVIHASAHPEKRADVFDTAREILEGTASDEKDQSARHMIAPILMPLRPRDLADLIKQNADNMFMLRKDEVDTLLENPPAIDEERVYDRDPNALLDEWALDAAWRRERPLDEDDQLLAALDRKAKKPDAKKKDARKRQKAARKKNRR